jgi:hypothetical protein
VILIVGMVNGPKNGISGSVLPEQMLRSIFIAKNSYSSEFDFGFERCWFLLINLLLSALNQTKMGYFYIHSNEIEKIWWLCLSERN